MMLCNLRVLTEDHWLLVNTEYEIQGLHYLLFNYLQKCKTCADKN
jgi:hypothetical protein